VIYTDESVSRGAFYSNFYGGVLVRSTDLDRLRKELEEIKSEVGFGGEVKWSKVTGPFLPRYRALMDAFFDRVEKDQIKVRVMFTQNVHVPLYLERYHREHAYHLLYYQFLKHALGLQYSDHGKRHVFVRIYLDQMPGTKEKKARFRGFVASLEKSSAFRKARIRIRQEDIAEVDSRDHVLLQCLDVVMGAMQFRLNDKHRAKPPGARQRGKRTIAKEKLYKAICARVRRSYPHFNVGITTGTRGERANRWRDPYRHWLFLPEKRRYDGQQSKSKKRPRSRYA